MSYHYVILAAVAVLRLWELQFSYRAFRDARADNSAELIPEPIYPIIVAVHALWLGGAFLEVILREQPYPGAIFVPALLLWIVALALRFWVLAVMNELWSVRLISRRGQRVVTGGPYRFVRHPNYVAVILEIAVVPIMMGAYVTAVLATLANAAVLFWRIRKEEHYLLGIADYRKAFEHKKRLIPGVF